MLIRRIPMLMMVLLLICAQCVFLSGYAAEDMDATGLLAENRGAFLSSGESGVFHVSAPEAGAYALRLTYRIDRARTQSPVLSVRVNGNMQETSHDSILLPDLWRDDSQVYAVNDYGNDLFPQPVHMEAVQTTLLRGRTYYADRPLSFILNEGDNAVEITARDGSVTVLAIEAASLTAPKDFAAYREGLPETPAPETCLMVEGEHYTAKTAASIRGGRSRSAALHPFDAAHNRINALDGGTWQKPGEGVHYTFRVEREGVYYVALRISQNGKNDASVYKTIQVDGQTPTLPLAAYGFPYTGSGVVTHLLACGGEAIPFYLTSGEHTLTLISTASEQAALHQSLTATAGAMNDLALDIRMIVGNRVDRSRDWQLPYYLPDVRERLEGIKAMLEDACALLEGRADGEAGNAEGTLRMAQRQIDMYLTDKDGMDNLVNQLSSFALASGSMAESISLLAPEMLLQPLTIDRVYVVSDIALLPKDDLSPLASMSAEITKTVMSFIVDGDEGQSTRKDALNVWMVGSTQQLEILREMASRAFPETALNISLVSNESKLQLAIAAGNAPDVVLGCSTSLPYQLGIRGAAYPLDTFDDYAAVAQRFDAETLRPLSENGTVYGLPQTLEMWVLFYRTDILEALGLAVPDTWDDVIEALPTLYRYGMNFNTVLAYGGALKGQAATTPLILASGGALYAEDGMSAAFSTPEFLQGFTLLTELYTKYGMATSVGNFYSSLRNGLTPMGISGLGTYVLLKEAASELDGLWSISVLPGLKTENGIDRSHPALSSACMMLRDTPRPQEAWTFLQWWMDAQTQQAFAQQLQTTYGAEYVWITANLQALEESSIMPAEDKAVMMAQLAHIRENPSHPASMLVERALSDAWNSVVFSGADVRAALDKAQLEADRGIAKKLRQLGFLDEAGQVVKTLWEAEP